MRLLLFLLIFSFSFTTAPHLWADTVRLPGKVSEAILYPNQAQLTLKASSTLGVGEHTILISRTAGYIDARTLQVRGTGDFTILSARLTQEFLPEANLPASIRALKDSVDDLRQEVDVLAFQRDAYFKEEEMLIINRKVTGDNTGLASTVEYQRALDFFRQRLMEVKVKSNALDEKIRKAKRHYEAAKAQLDQQSANLKAPVEQVAVDIKVNKPTTVTLYVNYLTNEAGWTTSYDARAAESKPKIDLVLKAQVRQNTGQNWEKVKLQFSSGNPGLGAEKPTLTGLIADFEQPRPVLYKSMRAAAPQAAGNVRQAEAMSMEDVAAPPDAQVVMATMDDGGLGLLFTLDQPANVPTSTSDLTTLELRRQELDAPQRLACAPALDHDVFVVATIRDWGNQNLLPGPVQVFYDGVFTGESYLPASTAQDSLQLSLGRERKVLVRRIAVPVKDAKNFLGNKKIQAYAFETTIVNNRKDAITLRLEDRIPVSKNEEITVEPQELSGATPDDQGILRYDVPLTPGGTKKVALRYQIRYPKEKPISIHGY